MKLSISIITYNQEQFIKQALESILKQNLDFKYEIVISDDASKDTTPKILKEYAEKYPNLIKLNLREKNVGAVRNYLENYKKCIGKYIAYLEGDDFFIDPYKLKKQVEFLDENPEYVMCFHDVRVADKEGNLKEILKLPKFDKKNPTVRELCKGDFIATPSNMVRRNAIKEIPKWLYELPGCDWPFDILIAEKGKIKYIPEVMSAYRVHECGIWSKNSEIEKLNVVEKMIEKINLNLQYKYKKEFEDYLKKIQESKKKLLQESKKRNYFILKSKIIILVKKIIKKIIRKNEKRKDKGPIEKRELLIIDNIFPLKLSGFRYQEYTSYLEYFKDIKILSTDQDFKVLKEERKFEDVLEEYYTEYPTFRGNIEKFDINKPIIGKLAYLVFLGNAIQNIEYIENNKIPFIFTLYPGGAFCLNDKISDERLKRLFESPYFRKVIVTQTITKEYLLKKNLCPEEKIEFIYGVVTPLASLDKKINNKTYYGVHKQVLDICFVSHKYTQYGIDKGYDKFIEVAKILGKKYENIRFHVVGTFDENEIPIDSIKDKIKFYGLQVNEWFDEFYKDKDIILSPNIPFKIMPGGFDGFPTGSVTEAGVRGLAMFCTDPLNLNIKYKDREDIVIIESNVENIVENIEYYYKNPLKLISLSKKGACKVKELYGYEAQIKPRIEILEKELRK